jgi:hypothetical protein
MPSGYMMDQAGYADHVISWAILSRHVVLLGSMATRKLICSISSSGTRGPDGGIETDREEHV